MTMMAGVSTGELASQVPRARQGNPLPAREALIAPPLKGTAGCAPAVSAWWKQTAGTGSYGRIVCAADPTRPAILLVHGLHQDGRTWTAPSSTEFAYDYKDHPGNMTIGASHASPNTGVYKVGKSKWLYGKEENRPAWDKANNWFDFLVQQGFTVATWSQNQLTMAAAMPSAREAFDSLLAQTAAASPAASPPVALIAHSRGGLVVRQLLKEKGTAGRVKLVVTLHSPHQGSELGRTPGKLASEIVDLIDCCAPPIVTAPLKSELKALAVEAMRPMTKLLMDDESRELSPGSPLLRNLAQGEKKLDDVNYYTFGGTNPRVYRLYTWMFDATSAVPQYKNLKQYFVWRIKPVEIASVSPILDKVRDFAPEVEPGKGDALVSDVSARLPWSIHTTTTLNHAELLWNQPLMAKVAGLIGGTVAAGRALPASTIRTGK
jgi:PGAP1-like protein